MSTLTPAVDRPLDEEGPPGHGLTSQQAAELAAAGLLNVDARRERTDADIIRQNALTFFNVVLLALIIALLAVGEFRDGLFVGLVVFANVVIATVQELRATHRLRELVALTAPSANVIRDGREQSILATQVVQGDLIHLRPGDQVVADGPILSRTAEVDESLLTGESESVRHGPGDELRSGSFCTAGDCYYRADRVGLDAYVIRLTAEARELVRRTTPLQARLKRIFRVVLAVTGVLAVFLMIQFLIQDRGLPEALRATTSTLTTVVPVGLILGLTVTFAVGALRVSRSGAIVQDTLAVEALNYVDVICLDKTGTLTTNRLRFEATTWATGMTGYEGWLGAFAVHTADESRTAAALGEELKQQVNGAVPRARVPFSSARRWSALTLDEDGVQRHFVMGAPETVFAAGEEPALRAAYERAVDRGLRGVVFAEADALPDPDRPLSHLRPLALLTLGDELRHEVRSAFELMDELGIEPKVISGDNPQTVASLLRQLDIPTKGGAIDGGTLAQMTFEQFTNAVRDHTVFGRIGPTQKADIVRMLRDQGHFVAMVGDGANDVQALRAADAAVAMASGTSTARAVAGIVLLRDSFEALIRGARQATYVLGNSAQLSKLFIAKSMYAYLLIVSTNMLGLDFPFLPRQGSITSLLSLGIPAIIISVSVPPPNAGRDFTRNVMRWAIPAAVALAASAMTVHFISQGILGRDIEVARTLVSLVIGFTAIVFVVEVLGFEGADWRRPLRPILSVAFGVVLMLGLVAAVHIGPLRNFFDFVEVGRGYWAFVTSGVLAALIGQYLLSRHWRRILDAILDPASTREELRGRAV